MTQHATTIVGSGQACYELVSPVNRNVGVNRNCNNNMQCQFKILCFRSALAESEIRDHTFAFVHVLEVEV